MMACGGALPLAIAIECPTGDSVTRDNREIGDITVTSVARHRVIPLDRALWLRHDPIIGQTTRVIILPRGNNDANPGALADLMSLVLSLANTISVSDGFQKDGLSIPEWTLLRELPSDGSAIALKKLCTLMGLTPQRVKVVIAKLEGRGMVEEAIVSEAHTTKRYAITQDGIALRSEAEQVLSSMQASMLSPSQVHGLARSSRIVRRLLKGALSSSAS